VIPLLLPFKYSLRNRFFPDHRPTLRSTGILVFGGALFIALFLVSLRVVGYFHSQNELGIILSLKIFQMIWMLFFFMLIFSSMVSGVSALFLSSDNEIFFSSPVSPRQIYLMRYITTTIYTSWMMVIFSMPIFGAFGVVFDSGVLYWPLLMVAVTAIALIGSGIGLATTVLLVNLFPARRTKDIVFYLSVLFTMLLYLVFRLIRPEDLANPERFPDFIDYLSTISNPAAPLLPPSWATNLLTGYLLDHRLDWLLIGLLLLTPLIVYYGGEWTMERMFFSGFSKAQESFGGSHSFKRSRYTPSTFILFMRKEFKTFLRDSSEWSQLFLVGALIVVYLYNFKALPLDRAPIPAEFIANLVAYANIGLTGFMVASLSARFVYPSISSEGGGFDLIRSSPLSLSRFFIYKYIFYVTWFTLLGLVLLLATNHLLQIKGPMLWISVATGLIITWTIVAMALGFGALYADFKIENRAAMLGNLGAIWFLFSAIAFELLLILLGSFPAYRLVHAWLSSAAVKQWDLIINTTTLLGMIILSTAIAALCLYKGIKRLKNGIY